MLRTCITQSQINHMPHHTGCPNGKAWMAEWGFQGSRHQLQGIEEWCKLQQHGPGSSPSLRVFMHYMDAKQIAQLQKIHSIK